MKELRLFTVSFIVPPLLLLASCKEEPVVSSKELAATYNPVTYVDGSLTDTIDGSADYSLKLYEPAEYSLDDQKNGTYSLTAEDPVPNVNLQYTLTINNGSKSVYFIFTNTSPYASSTYPAVNDPDKGIYQNIIPESGDTVRQKPLPGGKAGIRGKPEISEFNRNPYAFLNRINPVTLLLSIVPPDRPLYDMEGFGTQLRIDKYTSAPATCREVRMINTPFGAKKLNIWVADNCWYEGGIKISRVRPEMVTALADKFLQYGPENDIYDWVTNIYGEEWGPLSGSSLPERDQDQLIAADDEITIFLYDIDEDNSANGGVLGYFWGKDNFLKAAIPYSNERIMFYLDAVLFATTEGADWSINDKWPSETVSTLAHEFQHMIHFYQKNIMLTGGNGTEIWIDEMCSLSTEDLIARKILVDGPRGVYYSDPSDGPINNSQGRLPLFNYFNNFSVTSWYTGGGALLGYSLNYALGSYLSRNFGGAEFFRNVMHNDRTDYTAVEYALGGTEENFSSVLRKWGVSTLLSDKTGLTGNFNYNMGTSWNTSTISDIVYDLGSINLCNYRYKIDDEAQHIHIDQTGPFISDTMPTGTMPPASNFYYLAAENVSGTRTWEIPLRSNVRLNVVVRDSLPVSAP